MGSLFKCLQSMKERVIICIPTFPHNQKFIQHFTTQNLKQIVISFITKNREEDKLILPEIPESKSLKTKGRRD